MPSTPSDRAVRRARQAPRDIRDNVRLARGFVAGMTEAFVADRHTVHAVTRALEIASKAARRLPEEVRARHPSVPWRDVRGAGNVDRHDCEDVLGGRLWATLEHAPAPLEAAAAVEFARASDDDAPPVP